MKYLLPGLFLLSALHLNALDLPPPEPSMCIAEEPSTDYDGYWYVSGGVAATVPRISLPKRTFWE